MLNIPLPSPESHDVERSLTAHAPSDRVEEESGGRGRWRYEKRTRSQVEWSVRLWRLGLCRCTSGDRHRARPPITDHRVWEKSERQMGSLSKGEMERGRREEIWSLLLLRLVVDVVEPRPRGTKQYVCTGQVPVPRTGSTE